MRITPEQVRGRISDIRNDAKYYEDRDSELSETFTRDADFLQRIATQMETDNQRIASLEAEVERLKEQVRRACGLANDANAKELSEAYIREWRGYNESLKEVERLQKTSLAPRDLEMCLSAVESRLEVVVPWVRDEWQSLATKLNTALHPKESEEK